MDVSAQTPDPLRGMHAVNRAAIYRELRENTPVYWSQTHAAWVLTRYRDVDAALRHPDALALDPIPYLRAVGQRGGIELTNLIGFLSSVSLLTRPPRHDAIRRVLAQALAATRQMNLAALIERRAEELLADGAREGSIDLAAGFAQKIALFVIGSFFGIPDEDIQELGWLGHDLSEVFERRMQSVAKLRKLDARAASLTGYFERLLTGRRQKRSDADGTSLIVRLADETIGCDDAELAAICTFFFIAAEETTTVGLSFAALMLLKDDRLKSRLVEDPARVPSAVRESLRLASPLQFVFRQFRSDQEIAGKRVAAGEPVMLMLGAANRDPDVFPDPDTANIDRTGPESLAFAAGPYRCVGAQLATLELEIAMRKILEYPGLRLSSEPAVWSKRANVTPLTRLPAEFG
jgi:cytochrome P450